MDILKALKDKRNEHQQQIDTIDAAIILLGGAENVLVQSEMERGRSPLVSKSTLDRRHRPVVGIRGEDQENPVVLLIRGGPESSCSIFTPLIRSWESQFTVVQWDHRGSGKTLGRTGQGGTGELTMDRLVRDGIEVAEFVHSRLRKDKVILLACSFGTTFGLSC
jgi:pimeloyl-ACP methyl ester carboxylesterase